MDNKTCTRCKTSQPISSFNSKSKKKDGQIVYNSRCQKCTRELGKAHYEKHKAYYLNKSKRRNIEVGHENTAKLQEVKHKQGCRICGEKDPRCLDFHHLRDKKDNISNLAKRGSTRRLTDEINKCEIICSNCHRKHHCPLKIKLSG